MQIKKILIMFHDLTFLVSAGNFFKDNFLIDTIFCRIITSLIRLVFSYIRSIRYSFFLSLKRIQREKSWNVFLEQKNVEQKYFQQKKTFQRKLIAQWKSHQIIETTLFFLDYLQYYIDVTFAEAINWTNIKPNRSNVFRNATTTIP